MTHLCRRYSNHGAPVAEVNGPNGGEKAGRFGGQFLGSDSVPKTVDTHADPEGHTSASSGALFEQSSTQDRSLALRVRMRVDSFGTESDPQIGTVSDP